MSDRIYPDPTINLETECYWQAANDGKLLVKSCNACGKAHFYPRAICPECGSPDTTWTEATGRGRIYTYSVMRRADPPYAIAYVTLDEGVTMMSNIVEADFDNLSVDMAVEVMFGQTEGGQALPLFRPARGI
ncbi:Zn-ribbon domain-containing OB-fold protein [Tropicibacter sp. Alg240-R139]|uniref:Zn-ribbon domain-containing OB-fold protein n=1 Tax=Tropicibacter sp. Alg240-R139 TaxID=2305991 RepID=UPI0013E0E860|nr:Zn-ribbon domain-containing OB-fold protein [Tropicibacter sp. Alg240-R139]